MKKLILLLFIPLISFSSFGQTIKDNDEFISLNLKKIEAQFPFLIQELSDWDNFAFGLKWSDDEWRIEFKPEGEHKLLLTFCKSEDDYFDDKTKCIWAQYTVIGYDSFNEPIIGRLIYVDFPETLVVINKINDKEFLEFLD